MRVELNTRGHFALTVWGQVSSLPKLPTGRSSFKLRLPKLSQRQLLILYPSMRSLDITILPLRYNSQCIGFPEWVSLFTLCFAPLIAHIVSGAPQVSYLSHSRPRWHDLLCHYNPTSIIWRYAVIADRRIRANRWSRDDLTASNAIFWTATGWDGREDMVIEAAPHKLWCPGHTHVQIISVAMLKTTIVTMQGLSALYSVIASLVGVESLNFQPYMGVDMIFLPLSILGLLRLCAATWISEDFVYALHGDGISSTVTDNFDLRYTNSQSSFEQFLITPRKAPARFKPPSFWLSRIFRGTYLLIIGGVWGIALTSAIPGIVSNFAAYTTTSLLIGIFYFVFLTVSFIVYAFYFIRDQTTTTVLPCISTKWYKTYTFFLLGFTLVLVVIASIETNKDPYGVYVTVPPPVPIKCGYLAKFALVGSPYSRFFGLASDVVVNSTSTGQEFSNIPVGRLSNTSMEERYWINNFTGYCVGGFNDVR